MTNDDAITLIKSEMDLPESPRLNKRAQSALRSAFSALNRLGTNDWNTKEIIATLTVGKARYTMAELWPGISVKKIAAEIYFSDRQKPIDVVGRGECSQTARANSAGTGRPEVAMAIGTDKVIEFYPAPNDAYQIYTLIRFNIMDMSELGDDMGDLAVSRGLIHVLSAEDQEASFLFHIRNWSEGKKEITQGGGLTFWKGTQIQGMRHGLSDSSYHGSADSGNLMGD